MSTKKVYEDSDKVIYEKTDDGILGTGIMATGSKEYEAVSKHDNSSAKGDSVAAARSNLEAGKSKK